MGAKEVTTGVHVSLLKEVKSKVLLFIASLKGMESDTM